MIIYDFHTHNDRVGDTHIYSLKAFEDPSSCKSTYVSIGVHPWSFSNEDITEGLVSWFKKNINHPKVIAYGEMGLDLLRGAPIELQSIILKNQLNLVRSSKKPIVFHCVKSFDLIMGIVKELKINNPIIFHDYKGNEDITMRLTMRDAYFSFNHSLLTDEKRTNLIALIDDNRILFETDEHEASTLADLKEYICKMDRSDVIKEQSKAFTLFQSLTY